MEVSFNEDEVASMIRLVLTSAVKLMSGQSTWVADGARHCPFARHGGCPALRLRLAPAMTVSAGASPGDRAVSYRADVRRLTLVLPLSLLTLVTLASVVTAVMRRSGDDTFGDAWRGSAVFLALFYFGYIRRTVLTVSVQGVSLRQSFTEWTVSWTDIIGTWTTSNLDVSYNGGVAAGVHLKLRSGRVAFIPDVFGIHRRDLAQLVAERRAVRAVGERIGMARD